RCCTVFHRSGGRQQPHEAERYGKTWKSAKGLLRNNQAKLYTLLRNKPLAVNINPPRVLTFYHPKGSNTQK
ncbi:MAG: hypothetical protein V4714_14465, partial [Bacteroidota bacterium]